MQTDSAIVWLLSTYRMLESNRTTDYKSLPESLRPIRISDGEYYIKSRKTYYYPDAWNKPGRILLRLKNGGFYFVILGDKTRGTVVTWSRYAVGDPNTTQQDYLSPTYAIKSMIGSSIWVIPLGAIAIAITVFLAKTGVKFRSE